MQHVISLLGTDFNFLDYLVCVNAFLSVPAHSCRYCARFTLMLFLRLFQNVAEKFGEDSDDNVDRLPGGFIDGCI